MSKSQASKASGDAVLRAMTNSERKLKRFKRASYRIMARVKTGKCFTHAKYGYGNWVYRGSKKIRFVNISTGRVYARKR